MPIDIKNLNPSTKFPYPLPKEGEAPKKVKKGEEEWVRIKTLSVAKSQEIDELTTEMCSEVVQPKKPNGKPDRRLALQRIEYKKITAPLLRNELMWDEMISEIHIFDAEGVLIPSTKEMKIELMKNSSEFAMYVADCLEILTEDEKNQKKELEKNSSTSPSE
jgi:hypothetical protein